MSLGHAPDIRVKSIKSVDRPSRAVPVPSSSYSRDAILYTADWRKEVLSLQISKQNVGMRSYTGSNAGYNLKRARY